MENLHAESALEGCWSTLSQQMQKSLNMVEKAVSVCDTNKYLISSATLYSQASGLRLPHTT